MNTIILNQLELPKNFREESINKILEIAKRGESALLIAPAGMGKTLMVDLLEQTPKDEIFIRLDLSNPNFENLPDTSKGKVLIIGDNTENLTKETVQKLKNLREKNRPQTSIILCAESNILSSDAFSEDSSLRSILLENILYLPPLSENDSKSFAKAIAKQLNINLTTKQLDEIISQSGGAPRLIKRLVKLSQTKTNPKDDEKFVFDLDSLEIFCKSHPDYKFNSPLKAPASSKTVSDSVSGISFSQTLTKQEFALAKILIEANGELVSREDMIKAIWPTNLYETSEHALDQMIHRLKKKLETTTPKCELITLRARGAKLNIPLLPII